MHSCSSPEEVSGSILCIDSLISPMELILAITAVAIALIIAMVIKNCPTKLKDPVMETGRAQGKLALGKRDYESSDVTVIAQQETARE